jgi:hypothetical protein
MKHTLTAALIALIAASCQYMGGQRIAGDGHIITESKNVGSFKGIHVAGSMNVHVAQQSAQAVKIEGDQNLMPYIDVYVENGTLVVREKDGVNLSPSKDLTVYVSAPSFSDIDVSGAGNIISDTPISGTEPLALHVSGSGDINMQVNVPKVETHISGSGNVVLKGKASDFSVEMSGSGSVKCFDLATDNTKLDMSGSSDAEVTANKSLDIDVSGSGDVRYRGNASVNQRISGSGSVKKEG